MFRPVRWLCVADLHPFDIPVGTQAPDWAIIVRGGLGTIPLLRASIVRSFREARKHGAAPVYALSVFCFPELYADEAVRLARALNGGKPPNKQMASATAGAVRGIGAQVVRTVSEWPGHHSVRFPSDPSDKQLEDLIAVLAPARDSPRKDSCVPTFG